jgi:hypothetical protein|tara:strand:+ start:1907 stop:2140 length:234 start_codon:yes stop_codon:yes gene_type:complete
MSGQDKPQYEKSNLSMGSTILTSAICSLVVSIGSFRALESVAYNYGAQGLQENQRPEVIEFYRPRGDGLYIRDFEKF